LPAELKNGFDIATHEEAVDDLAAKDRVVDAIDDQSSVRPLLEDVFVNPGAIGTAQLLIDEAIRRFPRGDFGAPAHGDAVNAQSVIDETAFLHRDRTFGDDAKPEPGWSERLEVFRVGEVREHFATRARQQQL